LCEGKLSVFRGDTNTLLFSCGKTVFQAEIAYTLVEQPRTYVFNTTLENAYIKLVLPAEAERDDFEQTLLDAGLLKEGFPAAGDELGRGIAEGSAALASSIQSSAAQHTQGEPKEPMHVPKTLKALASQASSATQQAQDFTHKAAETIGHYAEIAGATTASYMKQGLQKSGWFEGQKSEARQTAENVAEGFSNAGNGIAQGFDLLFPPRGCSYVFNSASQVYGQSKDSGKEVLQHDAGKNVADVASNTGATVENVASVGADAFLVTSATFHGAKAAEGARSETIGHSS
jgi:hypothetical protein